MSIKKYYCPVKAKQQREAMLAKNPNYFKLKQKEFLAKNPDYLKKRRAIWRAQKKLLTGAEEEIIINVVPE